jgi:GTP cyclohydrolase I
MGSTGTRCIEKKAKDRVDDSGRSRLVMAIDKDAIEKHIRGILVALGDDPDREGLKETPARVAKMYEEVFEGMNYSNHEIAQMFNKTFQDKMDFEEAGNDMVMVKDIEIFSYCEHHLALMYDMKVSVAYVPNGKVIGLSKIARIADMVGKRLQLQERIGSDIAEIMQEILDTKDVAVVIEGTHSCMTARGIKKNAASTKTYTLRGAFREDSFLQMRLESSLAMPQNKTE